MYPLLLYYSGWYSFYLGHTTQFERELTSERVKDKIHQKAIKGLPHGGFPPPGYKWQDKKLVVDKKKAEMVKMIFDLYTENTSVNDITKILHEKGYLTKSGKPYGNTFIWYILRNPFVTGKIVHHDKIYPGQHEPIISEEVFNYAQTLHKNCSKKSALSKELPFTGIIRCDECGSIMSACHTNKYDKDRKLHKYYYYRCTSSYHKGWNACSIRQVAADKFHDILFNNMNRISMDTDYINNLVFSLKYAQKPPRLIRKNSN